MFSISFTITVLPRKSGDDEELLHVSTYPQVTDMPCVILLKKKYMTTNNNKEVINSIQFIFHIAFMSAKVNWSFGFKHNLLIDRG